MTFCTPPCHLWSNHSQPTVGQTEAQRRNNARCGRQEREEYSLQNFASPSERERNHHPNVGSEGSGGWRARWRGPKGWGHDRLWANPFLANVVSACVRTAPRQTTRAGHPTGRSKPTLAKPTLAKLACVCVVGSQRVGGPKISRFSPLLPNFRSFSLSLWNLLVNFGGVWSAWTLKCARLELSGCRETPAPVEGSPVEGGSGGGWTRVS